MNHKLKSILKEPEIGLYEEVSGQSRATKAEHLFDNIIGHRINGNNNYSKNMRRPALTIIETNSQTSTEQLEPFPKCSKTKSRVKFVENSGVKKKSSKTTKTKQKSSKSYPNCTKQSLLKAYESANLPDFDEIARHELHVSKADSKYYEKSDPPTPPLYDLLKPFEDLIDWRQYNLSVCVASQPDVNHSQSVPKISDTSSQWEETSNTDSSNDRDCDHLIDTSDSKVSEAVSKNTGECVKTGGLARKKLIASTPKNKGINSNHNQSENFSPIELNNTMTNASNVTQKQNTFIAPPLPKSKRSQPKVSISKNPIAISTVIASANSEDKMKSTTASRIDKVNSNCNAEKTSVTADNCDQSIIRVDSRLNNDYTSDHTCHAFQESECESESTIRNANHSIASIIVEKDVSSFAPKIKSTPLFNSRRKCVSDKYDNLKSIKSSRFDLFVDKSHLDASIFKLFGRSSKEYSKNLGKPLTTTFVPVFDQSKERDVVMGCSKNRKSKSSAAYLIYRKSIAAAHSIYNKTGMPCRTVIKSVTPVLKEYSVCVASNLQNRDELKSYVDKSMISLSISKVVYNNGNEEFLTPKQKVLFMCEPNSVINFNNVFEQKILNNIKKIGEGSYGEVYISKDDSDNDIVIKIIPINMCGDSEDDIFSQILPELVISATFNCLQNGLSNRSPNFIHLIRATCAMGLFPDKLIREWDDYASRKQSENEHPNSYKKNQLYIILHLANGGTDLESYKFKSAIQSLSVFLQLTFAIASSECEYQFEHRDLHWGNVLINSTHDNHLNYIIDGKHYSFQTHSVFASIIDFSLSRMSNEGFTIYDDLSKYPELFEGIGDYQFDIYRKMKQHNNNEWQLFCPYTNILWLQYLLDKLLNAKKYTSRSKNHKTALSILTHLNDNVLRHKSVTTFVESDQMKAYLKQFSDLK